MLYAILLGILQGITEFLPISSSGHLVLAQNFMPDFHSPGLVFDVILHAGTLLAVLAYYCKDIIWIGKGVLKKLPETDNKAALNLLKMIVIGTIPAAILGVAAEDLFEQVFEKPIYASFFLIGTGCILFIGEYMARSFAENARESGTVKDALLVGLAQAMALFPGISRSGSTMAAGLALGWKREFCARFSFLLMIPAVGGAVVLKLPDLPQLLSSGSVSWPVVFTGFISAALSGYLAIVFLLGLIKKFTFNVFAVYCMLAGIISVVVLSTS